MELPSQCLFNNHSLECLRWLQCHPLGFGKLNTWPPSSILVKEFSDMVWATGLKDLGFRGNTYTWANNKHGQAYVAARLDRAFSNTSWLDSFVDPLITHLPKLCSDHSPLLLSHRTRLSSANIPFKFEAMCLSHDSFFKVVETSWATCCSGNPQFILARKLKILKTNPKVWNKEAFGQLKVRIAEAERAVLVCQHSLDANPSEASHLELNSAKFSLHNYL